MTAKKGPKEKFYLGNTNLPTAQTEYDYTPDMIKEIAKCRKNILHFASNYFYIINVDEGRQKIKLHKFQKRILKALMENRFNILLASRQIGKALALDTPIKTPNGWTTMGDLKDGDIVFGLDGNPCNVVKAHDVLHNRKCYEIEFENGEKIVADADHRWFTISEKENSGSVKTTREIVDSEISHKIPRCKNIELNPEQKEFDIIVSIKEVKSIPVRCSTVDSKDSLFLCGKTNIATSNTTLMTIYALWVALFEEDQRILIVANKEQTAKMILKRIKTAFEMMPNFIKAGAVEYGQTNISLSNGSSIGISTTSSDAGRGESVNCLLVDEIAHIDSGLLTEFWSSVYPIISSAKKSKILAASTPKGIGNLFHDLWEGANKTGEEWNGWHGERVDWWEVPNRDEKWKLETMRTIGSREAFMQEFENAFLASGEIPIDKDVYDMLESGCKDPEYIFDDGQYVVWDEPNEKSHYVVGVDVGEGLNQNATVCQILNITDLTNITQDAVYYTKKISPYYFAQKLHDLLQQWGRPPVLIERNGCGAQVIDSLKMNYGYENIVTWGTKGAISNDFKITNKAGIISHQNSKIEAVTNMRYFLNEMRSIKIRDIKTLSEIKDFIRHPNGTWSGRTANTLDDRVMALVWATAIFINDICKRYYEMIAMDDNQRPLKIKPIDYGITDIVSPSNIYVNEKDAQAFMPLPTVFSNPIGTKDEFSNIPDYEILKKDGWDIFTKDFNF
jgi:hypothetical protein